MIPRRPFLILAGALLAPFTAAAQDAARAYPSRPITLIVPYAAGGSSDVRARQVGQKLAASLGQPLIVDNKPGANGNIGTLAIAKAAPDGYTIGIGNLAPLTVNRTLIPGTTPFDPATDLVPVALIEKGPLVLVVNDKSPYRNAQELLAAMKAKPGRFSYASAGSGGSFHLAGEMFKSETGVFATHIPYRGGGPAMNDMLSGQVDYMFEMVPSAIGYLKASPPKLRALAVAHDRRLPSLPDVPTFAELGIRHMEISNWFGIVAPKGTPKAIVDKLNAAINQALREPDLALRITEPGNVVGGGTPAQFAEFIGAETQRWGQLIRDRNIKSD
ncbi:Bug family tripartite tricarboxylate transporter substrate binding protein [Caenimonas aquaedulcis]|uniref:Tripartite tricarboxylate transporter substrate binding protein n=1 Tax=Caenimonas aquaedulcis TaxID=2793270 RepID=A0A931H4Q0_9BURK|nr:tripartite tricarboxylate transporter substrate binding protein [Caenimonas aquaedulcis]MBG9388581.1 tripartite tricarboxylate transporter substrate binding protein [Caenimonas aquaedulcis]